jgi:predicted solute-binding protein
VSIQIAAWNYPPADLLTAGFMTGPLKGRAQIRRAPMETCERLLRDGEVECALLPTLNIIRNVDAFDVLPAVALSSWTYPFARLVLDHGLDTPIRRVAFDPTFEQETFLTRLGLREHYRMEPEFVALEGASIHELLDADADGHLLVGPTVPTISFDRLTFDVGQEWYELAQYPMCWGLFATLKGQADPDLIRLVLSGVRASEKQRHVWIRAQETSQDLHTFYAEDLRLRLDDLVVASLTQYHEYLFYYDQVEEVRDLPFVFLPGEPEEEDLDES